MNSPKQKTNILQSINSGRMLVWFIVVLAIIFAGVIWWYSDYRKSPAGAPSGGTPETGEQISAPLSGGDTTKDINQDLQSIDLGNIEEETNQLDSDINQL